MQTFNFLRIFLFSLIFLPFALMSQDQIGDDIDAEGAFDFFGICIAISGDGQVVAIGAPFNDGVDENAGHVRVFKRELNSWIPMGEDIDGDAKNDHFGRNVALSYDGQTLIIGADKSDINGPSSGHIEVYSFSNGEWVQKGQDIVGGDAFDIAGLCVSISSDGDVIAFGAPGNGVNGANSGLTRVFTYEDESWVQLGVDIPGQGSFDYSGASLALSADGTRIAISSKGNSDIADLMGKVRIYEYNGV